MSEPQDNKKSGKEPQARNNQQSPKSQSQNKKDQQKVQSKETKQQKIQDQQKKEGNKQQKTGSQPAKKVEENKADKGEVKKSDKVEDKKQNKEPEKKGGKSQQRKDEKVEEKKEDKKVYQFKCKNGKNAEFACINRNCNSLSIICIQNCRDCQQKHKNCSHQIKIEQLLNISKRLQNQAPITRYKNDRNDSQLIQLMMKKLQQVKRAYDDMNKQAWGITNEQFSFIFQKQIDNKKGSILYSIKNDQKIYPDTRYYLPPKLKKDVDQLIKKIEEFGISMTQLHHIYKSLAELDCKLTYFTKHRNKLNLFAIQKLIEQETKIVERRLQYNANIEENKQPLQKQIQDFKKLSTSIFQMAYELVLDFDKKKNYSNGLALIKNVEKLFVEQRMFYRLKRQDFLVKYTKLQQLKGLFQFQTNDYMSSYEYYSNLDSSEWTTQVLDRLIKMGEALNKQPKQLLKYLLLLIQKIQQQKRLEIMYKILGYYQILEDDKNIYEYNKKIIQKELQNNIEGQKFNKLLKRFSFCINYEQKQGDISKMMKTIASALAEIQNRQAKQNKQRRQSKQRRQYRQNSFARETAITGLSFRYKQVLHHFSMYLVQYQVAATARIKCKKYLSDEMFKNSIKIAEYYYKFLLIQAKGKQNQNQKLQLYREAQSVITKLGFIIFQPVYQMAKIFYRKNNKDALLYQDKALKIYPTATCYTNKAYLLYKLYLNNQHQKQLLYQCVQSIDCSLLLDPTQNELYHLRAIANQNFGRYEESNADFNKVVSQDEQILFDLSQRKAENYQFIIKQSSQREPKISEAQKQPFLKEAQKLYQFCLSKQPNNVKCMLGYARVLRLQKNLTESEKWFRKNINNKDYGYQIHMYLGNIKQQQANENDEINFQFMEEALEFYKKGGNSQQNRNNRERVEIQLGLR